jgi:hypothetical protein
MQTWKHKKDKELACLTMNVCWKNWNIRQTHTHTKTHTHTHTHTYAIQYFSNHLLYNMTVLNINTWKCYWECKRWTNICDSSLPSVRSWFEDITFYLLQHMMNGHSLQLHHTSVVCIYNPVSGFGVVQDILYGIICIGKQDSKYDHVFPQESKTN